MSPLLNVGTVALAQRSPETLLNPQVNQQFVLPADQWAAQATTAPVAQQFGGQVGQAPTNDAIAFMRLYLQSLGLDDPAMITWATRMLVEGASQAQIELELREQPSVRRRFAAVFDREAAGLAPISFADVLAYESQARQFFQEAGLPSGFYDAPEDFRRFIGGDVSLRELSLRVQGGFLALEQGDQTVRDEMQRLYGVGVDQGSLAAWALDEDRAVPTILRQVQAAQIGAAGRPVGFMLTSAQLESLAAFGVTQAAARAGFAELGTMQGLFGALPGEGVGDITQQQQLGAAFTGDVAAQRAIARRQEERVAQFQTGGGAIVTTTGSPTFR